MVAAFLALHLVGLIG